MKHIVVNKDVFENHCRLALRYICEEVTDTDESYRLFEKISNAHKEYKGYRASIDEYIVDLIKKYSKSNWVGTELVDHKPIEDSIEFIEKQQDRLYDILKKYEHGVELTTADYITLQECQPFWGYNT